MSLFEAHLSTESSAPGQDAWISDANEDGGRAPSIEAAAPEAPLPPDFMKVDLARQTFPKSLRLLRQSEFRRAYEQGQRRSSPLCAVFIRPNGLPQTRVGITVPARLGGAVLRNRLKRRLREVIRLNRPAIPGGWDIVLNPRPAVATIAFPALVREIVALFPSRPPRDRSGESQPW